MNLWVRLIYVLLRLAGWRLAGRHYVDLYAVTRLTLRVWPNDLDTNLHVNNGRYLTIGDLGRFDWFMRVGVGRIAFAQGAFPVVGDALAKFRRSLEPFQTFTLETRLLGWDEKWGFIEHRFIRHGRVLGVVVIRGVFLSKAGAIKPAELLSALAHQQPSPPLPTWVQQWSESCNLLSSSLRSEEHRVANPDHDTKG